MEMIRVMMMVEVMVTVFAHSRRIQSQKENKRIQTMTEDTCV